VRVVVEQFCGEGVGRGCRRSRVDGVHMPLPPQPNVSPKASHIPKPWSLPDWCSAQARDGGRLGGAVDEREEKLVDQPAERRSLAGLRWMGDIAGHIDILGRRRAEAIDRRRWGCHIGKERDGIKHAQIWQQVKNCVGLQLSTKYSELAYRIVSYLPHYPNPHRPVK